MNVNLKHFIPFWIILYFARSRLFPSYIETYHFASLYFLACVLLIFNWKKILPLLLKDTWMILLIILIGLSTLWSVTPYISIAEFRTSIVLFILAGYITGLHRSSHVINYISFTLGFLVIMSFIYESIGVGDSGAFWKGVFAHQSTLSTITGLATISIFNSFHLSKRKSKLSALLYFILICIYLTVIVHSGSRTPLVALITSFSILPFAYIHKIRPLRIRTSYCIFLAYFFLLILPSLWLKKDFIIVDLLRKTPDLTGRSHTWELLREKIFERPLLGYGQGAFWHNKDLSHEITSQLGRQVPQLYNSHSSYYDCLLNLGLIGFSILLIILFIKTKSSMALLLRNQKLESQWCVQIIIFCIVGGYSDVGYFIFPRAMGWFAISIVSLMSIQNLKDLDSNETILSDNPYLLKKKFRYRCAKSLSKPIQDFRIFFAKT